MGNDSYEALLLSWEVSPEKEEPWRRFLQELSGSRSEEHERSRRLRGVRAESVWLVPGLAPVVYGGGMAIFYLEAAEPRRALAELAASETPFDEWYRRRLLELCGLDLSRPPHRMGGELLFAWREATGHLENRS